jgi:hypothetical protein
MSNIHTTAVGSWGDSLCAYGNICKLLEDRGEEKANLVYFGLDQNVCEFFKAQDNIDKVSWLKIDKPELIGRYIALASKDPQQWAKETGIDHLQDLHHTHITLKDQFEKSNECNRDFDPQLPPCQGGWPEFLAEKRPYILFQPYSTQSCDYSGHWPYWKEALRYVLEKTDKNVVVVGEMPETLTEVYDLDCLEHPRMTCLIGQTRSMNDVFHIANRAAAIVTTSNAISIWSILKNIPALVACNRIIKEGTPYYYNWIKDKPNVVLDHESNMEHFRAGFAMIS